MAKLVRVSKTKDHSEIPVAVSTLYKWRHLRKHPKLFVKVGGALFIDLDRLDAIIEAGRQG